MLKKLRIRFVVINMSIVTIMLVLIFSLLYVSTENNLKRESIRMMNTIAMEPRRPVSPNERKEDVRLPYFSILVDRNGETVETGGGFFDLSDRELVNSILQQTKDAEDESGVLGEYNLRFLRVETPMGSCYVFSDISSEQAMLRSLLRTFTLIGLAAFLGFLGISVLLARWSVRPVETAWVQQKQFVADASHELKTPLTVIMTDAELLRGSECSEQEREQLTDSILTMSGQMRGLVESLLELARVDGGAVKEAMRRVSLSDIAGDVAMLFEPVFFEKELTFSYELEPEITLTGNDAQLRQLVNILLDNASKYSSPGGETTLKLRRESSRKCLITVASQGEQLSEEELKNLFKRFYRADRARTACQSYGLGLSIAERIVGEHGGKIRAESRDGVNTFTVELPC